MALTASDLSAAVVIWDFTLIDGEISAALCHHLVQLCPHVSVTISYGQCTETCVTQVSCDIAPFFSEYREADFNLNGELTT